MNDSELNNETLDVQAEIDTPGKETAPEPHQDGSIVNELWNVEDDDGIFPLGESNSSDALKFELETLAIERARLLEEKQKLNEMLESIKLEEEVALLRGEVTVLAEENEKILFEIQRRKQSPATQS